MVQSSPGAVLCPPGDPTVVYLHIHESVSLSTANLQPGRSAAGTLRPEGRRGDRRQL